MVKDNGALRPEIFNIKGFINQERKDDEATVEEKILATGAEQIFWKTLKTYFDNSIQQLEQINEQAIANGMALDEIGRNALVISQVKGVLRKIVNVVQDAQEAVHGGKE
jgi:hypothetical protein